MVLLEETITLKTTDIIYDIKGSSPNIMQQLMYYALVVINEITSISHKQANWMNVGEWCYSLRSWNLSQNALIHGEK